MILKIKNKEIRECLSLESPEFPKYVTQIFNLANQNAQGTRPKMVGQMSDLIQEFQGKNLPEWEKWYLGKHPTAIQNASAKIMEMVKNFQEVVGKINQEMVERWVKDLVIVQTFLGLKFQEAILKKVSEIIGKQYKIADSGEESMGIDGYIGNMAVSIKPITYKNKMTLQEDIKAKIIFYEKLKDGIEVDYSELLK